MTSLWQHVILNIKLIKKGQCDRKTQSMNFPIVAFAGFCTAAALAKCVIRKAMVVS